MDKHIGNTDSLLPKFALLETSIPSESSKSLCETCENNVCDCNVEGIIDCSLDKPILDYINTTVLPHHQQVSPDPYHNLTQELVSNSPLLKAWGYHT